MLNLNQANEKFQINFECNNVNFQDATQLQC